jgi:hypothetical protein
MRKEWLIAKDYERKNSFSSSPEKKWINNKNGRIFCEILEAWTRTHELKIDVANPF